LTKCEQHCEVDYAVKKQEINKKLQFGYCDLIITELDMLLDKELRIMPMLSRTKVLVLSSSTDTVKIARALKLGIAGYVLKHCGGDTLKTAIDTIANGGEYYCYEIMHRIMQGMKMNKKNYSTVPCHLTDREKEIILLIAEEYTTRQISKKLGISMNTVETHRKNIFSKLGVKNSAGLMKYALQNGLLEERMK
jgi:DNA-binding NarL/FixJ family response regulator